MKSLRLATLCASLAVGFNAGSLASAHDNGSLHLHANGSVIEVADVAAAPAGALARWFARVPAPVWGVASVVIAASLLRRRRLSVSRDARARA